MPLSVPGPLVRLGLSLFRLVPRPLRLALVRLGTPNYTVGVLALVRRGDEMLFVRQRHTGQWALPGGLLNRGETAHTAIQRELAEELDAPGLTGRLGLPVGVLVDPRPQRIDILYAVELAAGTPPPRPGSSPEVLATAWFGPAALPSLTPVSYQILDEYVRVGVLPPGRLFTVEPGER